MMHYWLIRLFVWGSFGFPSYVFLLILTSLNLSLDCCIHRQRLYGCFSQQPCVWFIPPHFYSFSFNFHNLIINIAVSLFVHIHLFCICLFVLVNIFPELDELFFRKIMKILLNHWISLKIPQTSLCKSLKIQLCLRLYRLLRSVEEFAFLRGGWKERERERQQTAEITTKDMWREKFHLWNCDDDDDADEEE